MERSGGAHQFAWPFWRAELQLSRSQIHYYYQMSQFEMIKRVAMFVSFSSSQVEVFHVQLAPIDLFDPVGLGGIEGIAYSVS